MAEIEETVRDTALSLIGVESLDNDEPLMDAGTLDHEFSGQKNVLVAVTAKKTKTETYQYDLIEVHSQIFKDTLSS